jgi:hypothetical protein
MAIFLIFLAAVVLTFLFLAALRRSEFHISRSQVMHAPASLIFAQVNDLHLFNAWSPWVKMDPDAEITYTGPQAGVDACMAWKGKKTGVGSMTVTESKPGVVVACRLEFLKPMKATNHAEFTFVSEGDSTTVTWSMRGKRGFIGKLFDVVLSCDAMVAKTFEKGLADLKARVESK